MRNLTDYQIRPVKILYRAEKRNHIDIYSIQVDSLS